MLKPPPSARALAGLDACNGPAWLIDAVTSRVVAANSSGLETLGLELDPAGADLDAAMPALFRLREIARSGDTAGEHRERLVFWTRRGVSSQPCIIKSYGGPGEAPLFLVHAPPSPSNGVGKDVTANVTSPRPRDDHETLREIAQRILNGQAKNLASVTIVEPPSERPPSRDVDDDGSPTPSDAVVDNPPAIIAEESTETPDAPNQDPPLAPQFTARLAHELKTPLSAILAAAEVMKDQRLGPMNNPRYHGYSADIHDNARHALSVIDRMLQNTGSDTGAERSDFDFTDIDLNELAKTAMASFAPLADAAHLKLSTDLSEGVPVIMADAQSLRQILNNLLTNAAKFTPAGGRITIATSVSTNGPIRLEVRDTGPGMTASEIAWSLDADDPPSVAPREGGGLGLGLPLVRRLAEANGARFSIDSRPGQGTAAIVTFARNRLILI